LNRKEYENVTAELAEDAKGLIRDNRLDILQLFSALLAAFAVNYSWASAKNSVSF